MNDREPDSPVKTEIDRQFLYEHLKEINRKPEPFEVYTADVLWTDPHISARMLALHLDETVDMASRNRLFIERSVEWIVSRFAVDSRTRICDFGCGPGLYTSRLAARGAQVTGVDFSKRSVEHARVFAEKERLNIDYVLQNYLEYEPQEQYDLITMIMCDFCALSPEQRKRMLDKFHRLLKNEGRLLLDVYSLSGFGERKETAFYEHNLMNGFWSCTDYFGFMNTFKYEREKVVLDKYTILDEEDARVVYNWLQYYDRDVLAGELQRSGFSILDVYGNVAGSRYSESNTEFAVVAGKN